MGSERVEVLFLDGGGPRVIALEHALLEIGDRLSHDGVAWVVTGRARSPQRGAPPFLICRSEEALRALPAATPIGEWPSRSALRARPPRATRA